MDGANALLEEALALAERAGSDRAIAYACTWLSYGYVYTGDPERAREHGERAHALADRLAGDQYIYFKSLGGLCHADYLLGDIDALSKRVTLLLGYGERRGNMRAHGLGHMMASYLAHLRGDIDLAVDHLDKMRACSVDPYYQNMAGICAALFRTITQDFGSAREQLRVAGTYFEGARNTMFLPYVSLLEGVIDLDEGRLTQGMRNIEAGRGMCESVGYAHGVVVLELSLGVTYINIARGEGDVSLGTLLKNMGFVFRHAIGARGRAVRVLSGSLPETARRGIIYHLPMIRLELAKLYAHGRKSEQARAELELCLSSFESRGADVYLAEGRALLAQLDGS